MQNALDIGVLNDRRERFFCHASRFQKVQKIRAFTQLGDAKLDCPGPRLPVAATIAVALNKPVGGPLAGGCACQRTYLQFHQALGGEAYHLAQNIRVGGLLDEGAQVHHGGGHRRILGCVCVHSPA